jgi:hypothetical protein
MMLTNQVKENVVARMGLGNHEITFHSESENSFLVIVSDNLMTTIVRVSKTHNEHYANTVTSSNHSVGGVPTNSGEILSSVKEAMNKETGLKIKLRRG